LTALLPLVAPHGIPYVAVALPDAPLLLVAEPEAGNVDLRNRDRYEILPFSADELAVGDVLAEVLADFAPNDVPEPRVVLIDLEAHLRFHCSSRRAKRVK